MELDPGHDRFERRRLQILQRLGRGADDDDPAADRRRVEIRSHDVRDRDEALLLVPGVEQDDRAVARGRHDGGTDLDHLDAVLQAELSQAVRGSARGADDIGRGALGDPQCLAGQRAAERGWIVRLRNAHHQGNAADHTVRIRLGIDGADAGRRPLQDRQRRQPVGRLLQERQRAVAIGGESRLADRQGDGPVRVGRQQGEGDHRRRFRQGRRERVVGIGKRRHLRLGLVEDRVVGEVGDDRLRRRAVGLRVDDVEGDHRHAKLLQAFHELGDHRAGPGPLPVFFQAFLIDRRDPHR